MNPLRDSRIFPGTMLNDDVFLFLLVVIRKIFETALAFQLICRFIFYFDDAKDVCDNVWCCLVPIEASSSRIGIIENNVAGLSRRLRQFVALQTSPHHG